jgi:hypothetical protein
MQSPREPQEGPQQDAISVRSDRIRQAAEKLGIQVPDIADVTDDMVSTNRHRQSHNKELPEGMVKATRDVLKAASDGRNGRLATEGYPIGDNGRVEIAPEKYGQAHEVTKALDKATTAVDTVLGSSLNPDMDQNIKPQQVVNSEKTYGYAEEMAIMTMLGISEADFDGKAPDSALEVDGGTVYKTIMETPAGVVYERETHLGKDGKLVYSSGSILPKNWQTSEVSV